MSDVTKRVSLEFDTNAAAVARDVRTLSDSVDEAGRTSSLSSNQVQKMSRSISSMEKTLGLSTHSVRKYSDSFAKLRLEASKAEQALQSAAQARVVKGKTDPLTYSANQMSLSDAQKNLAVSSASNLSLNAVSQKRVDLENRLTAAKERSVKADRDLTLLSKTQLEQTRERLSLAKEELSAAKTFQRNVSRRVGGGSVEDQVAAEERLAKAKQENVAAQKAFNSAEIKANEKKKASELEYEAAMRAAATRLAKIHSDRLAQETREELRIHNLRMQKLTERTTAESAAAQKIATERAKSNASSAQGYQRAFTDPRSFLGQANSRDASTGLKARDTTWAREAQALEKLNLQYDAHVQAYRRVQASTKQLTASLPTLRYALYDVSNSLAIGGAGLTAFSALSIKAAIDYERAFANVIRTNDGLRTSQEQASSAFKEFVALAGEIPVTFDSLAKIGTLAGQLGLQTQKLESFTRTVAMFAATTGVSVEESATAFGRLDKLLPGVKGDFEALGSSILNVGINSVATEADIIKITSQLAGVANQAGLSYDQLVALSGSLASVGIQPELARGTITRFFGQISRAVALGGENLQDFATISGMTAEEFKSSWGSSPMATVVEFLEGLDSRGSEAEAALRAVGIASTRDTGALLKLAGTVDTVLNPALRDASAGATEATQLYENYGVIASTLASKLQRLKNNFTSLMASMSSSTGLLGGLVEGFNSLLESAIAFAQTPWGGAITQLSVLLTAVVGGLALLAAGFVRAAASALAMRTALTGVNLSATTARGRFAELTAMIFGFNTATLAGSRAVKVLNFSLATLGVTAGALLVFSVAKAFNSWATEAADASVDIDTLGRSLSRLGTDSAETVEQVQKIIDKSVSAIGRSAAIPTTIDLLAPSVDDFDIQGRIDKAMASALNSYDAGLAAIADKTRTWWNTNPLSGQPGFISGLLDGSYKEIEKFEQEFVSAWENATSETQKAGILEQFERLEDGVIAAGGTVETLKFLFSDFYAVQGSGISQTKLAAETQEAFNEELRDTQEELSNIVDDVFSSVNGYVAVQKSLFDLGNEFVASGAKAAFSGDAMQKAIKAITEQSGSAPAAAANLKVFYDFLLNSTDASVQSLELLKQTIAGVLKAAGGKVVTPTISLPNFSAFTQGLSSGMSSVSKASKKAAKDVEKVIEKVRTLVDYAGDLASIWNRAFDIRFSGQNTLDAITSTLQSFRDAAEQSAKKVRDLQGSIRSLTADIQVIESDISILEYFLSIAVKYGDTERALAIEAELAKKRAELANKTDELADKNKELKDEQDSQSKALTGNTKAAIENRQAIQDLVKKYEDQINKLASSGLSQDALAVKTAELKQEFLDQATALGFNREELELYAQSFKDLSSIIATTPVGITVDTSGLGPAEIAIKEFAARANEQLRKVGTTEEIGGPTGAGSGFKPILDGLGPDIDLAGKNLGTKLKDAFMAAIPAPISRKLGSNIYDAVISGQMTVEDAARKLGYGSKDAFLASVGGTLPTDVSSIYDRSFQVSSLVATKGGTSMGQAAATSTNSSLSSGLNFSTPVVNATPAGVSASSVAGSLMGNATAGNFSLGLTLALDRALGRSGKARNFIRDLTGFKDGGYVGAGGTNEVMGVVHGGEYVLTKQQVDQSSGLPKMSALMQFLPSAPSRSVAPAASQPGGGGVQTVALTAGTIQAIAQATGKVITLDGRIVAESSASEYSHQTNVGAF